jgi:hypothetical protein
MRLSPILAVVLAFAAAAPLGAQQAASAPATKQQEEAEVLAVVNRLWEAMRTRDSVMARTVFDTSARMLRVRDRDGTRTVVWSRPEGFISMIGRDKEPMIERMVNPEVRVDQNIASVWTWYDFTNAGRLSHCGFDSIELARTTEGWKIVYISDTMYPAPCRPPGV